MVFYMLTTKDNPFSPVTNYDEWMSWDIAHGYNSNAFLARVAAYSPDLSGPDQDAAIQEAIDEIVTENVSGVHTKVRGNSEDDATSNESESSRATSDAA